MNESIQASPAPTSILAALLGHAAAEPERACVHWAGQTYNYGELVALAGGWAGHFSAMGLQRGERVGLFLPSGPAFLGAYLGAQMAGAAAVLINTQYRQVELSHILSDSAPRMVVCDPEGSAHVAQAAGAAGAELVVVEPEAILAPGAVATTWHGALPESEDLAILAYTSGTTGRAKGAMLTHGCLAANSAAVCAAWAWTRADRLLLVLPLFHIHGLGVGVHGTLVAGASLELHARFEPQEALTRLASGAVSMFFGVPTIYSRLIETARQQNQPQPLPLRLCVSGSAPLAPQTLNAFEALTGQRILERYGMTETGMNLTNPYTGERRAGTVGMAFPGQEARVVAVRSRLPLPDGEIGEVQVRGPHVCAGYWRNATATAEVFGPDGWFSTGDLGWCSADGYYTLTGRARELIISGGYNIYPREVEELLLGHPGVAECAVFGAPDADMGEQVVAAVVVSDPENPPRPEELADYCREQMAAYKRPRRIYYVAALPRNAMGKVQKHELKASLVGK
jgi:malonyl-CoA/methylmalonyl-CoA synthetase